MFSSNVRQLSVLSIRSCVYAIITSDALIVLTTLLSTDTFLGYLSTTSSLATLRAYPDHFAVVGRCLMK